MEGLPKFENISVKEYDAETARIEAVEDLNEMIEAIEAAGISEDVPENFRYAFALRQVLKNLEADNSEKVDNSLRFVAEAAANAYDDERRNMSQFVFDRWQLYVQTLNEKEATVKK